MHTCIRYMYVAVTKSSTTVLCRGNRVLQYTVLRSNVRWHETDQRKDLVPSIHYYREQSVNPEFIR